MVDMVECRKSTVGMRYVWYGECFALSFLWLMMLVVFKVMRKLEIGRGSYCDAGRVVVFGTSEKFGYLIR